VISDKNHRFVLESRLTREADGRERKHPTRRESAERETARRAGLSGVPTQKQSISIGSKKKKLEFLNTSVARP
jgi:hypothetical protein